MRSTAAFFDVDGTLINANAVNYYLDLATHGVSPLRQGWMTARLAAKIPYYLLLDRIDRDRFNHAFYQNYRGFYLDDCQQWSQRYFHQVLESKLFPAALACIAQHRAAERQIILVTGSLDFIVAPLAEFLGATALSTRLEIQAGQFTGRLVPPSLAGAGKVRCMQDLAHTQGIDLAQSYAYGDSKADLAMLQAVGNPVAINPDARLNRVALDRGWPIESWNLKTYRTI